MSEKPSIIFFGTPEFAVPSLKALIDYGYDIKAVVTRPDKPVGRKQILTPPPVKTLALNQGIALIQPDKITDEVIAEIDSLKPDLYVIVAYGKILPQVLLDIPPKGSINIHPSLLPKYRGPSPLQATLLSDDAGSGVCIMLIDEEMDHGPILKKIEHPLKHTETYESLGNELFKLGAQALPEVIEQYLSGALVPQQQDHQQATFTKLIKKEDGQIHWNEHTATSIERMTRAYAPWPGAFGTVNATDRSFDIKIIASRVPDQTTDRTPGTIYKTAEHELAIACNSGSVLLVDTIQPSGKPQMSAEAFMAGYLK